LFANGVALGEKFGHAYPTLLLSPQSGLCFIASDHDFGSGIEKRLTIDV
jgi:hypothetical protein